MFKIGILFNKSFLHENKTGIVAHRGAHINAPENTLKAIQQAGILGYEMVELDVQRTSDGQYVLMHDSTVDRTTNGSGTVSSMTLSEIKALIVDEDYVGKNSDEIIRVPTFEEACQECARWGLGINVDCSKMTWTETIIHDIVKLLKKYSLWNKSFFVMDDRNTRLLLTNLYPDANVTWLGVSPDPNVNIDECKNYLNAFLSYSNTAITDDLIMTYKSANIPLFVYSCNTWYDVYKYKAKGVRFVETDTQLPGGVY